MRKRLVAFLVMICLSLTGMAFVGCGQDKADGVKVDIADTFLSIGYDEVVNLTVETEGDAKIEWSSSDVNLLKVNSFGIIAAQKHFGTAVITAKAGNSVDTCTVEIVPKITIGVREISLIAAETAEENKNVPDAMKSIAVTATASPASSENDAYIWTSSDETVVSVTSAGGGGATVTANKPGTATLMVMSPDGASDFIPVTVDALNTNPAVVTFKLTLPEALASGIAPFLVGNNSGEITGGDDWGSLSEATRFTKSSESDKIYSLTVTMDFDEQSSLNRTMEYKFVLNVTDAAAVNWSYEEVVSANRILLVNGGTYSVECSVSSWKNVPSVG